MNAAKLYPIMHEFIHVHVTAVVLAAASLNVYLPKCLVGTRSNVCVHVWGRSKEAKKHHSPTPRVAM